MSWWRLIQRSLVFYRRTNAAVLLAAAVTTAVLTGALAVGDSVRHSLAGTLEARLAKVQLALAPQGRFFSRELAERVSRRLNAPVASVLQVRGVIANDQGTQRANGIVVLGVDRRFYEVGPGQNPWGEAPTQGIVLSDTLADRLGVAGGDEVVLRFERPGLMPRDVPLTPDSDRSIAARLVVRSVAGPQAFGRFGLQADQLPPLNAFVPLGWLAEQIGRPSQANMLLVGGADLAVEGADQALRQSWQLADVELTLSERSREGVWELRSRRVFIDESLEVAALGAAEEACGVLTYFVNELRAAEKATPYSMVAAVDPNLSRGRLIPADMAANEIVVNQWLADDLSVRVGDRIELRYYVLGPMRKLIENRREFRVRDVLAMEGAAIDPNLMPDYPGLADADNCRDWDPGIPVDLDKIRKNDEDYWDAYRGTPKAFVTLSVGQELWRNRYGGLTAVRYPAKSASVEEITERLHSSIDPSSAGLFFQAVRARGVRASREGTDFGQLFLGLSMFLIAAAVVLTALVFVFGSESRSEQVGLLLALGFRPGAVRRLLLLEGGVVALCGAVVGTGVGLLYTRGTILALTTLWKGAVGGSHIAFSFTGATLLYGGLGGLVAAVLSMLLTLRKQARRSARELLSGVYDFDEAGKRPLGGTAGPIVSTVCFVVAVGLVAGLGGGDSEAAAGACFGAGALLLVAALVLTGVLLSRLGGGWRKAMVSLWGLGLRNATRRRGRSLAVASLLACGVFMTLAVGANQHNPLGEPSRRDSGTGGFALYGEATVPILHDLNSDDGRASAGLDVEGFVDVRVVQFRVRAGDDASCLNLNRAQRPRLLGVSARQLAEPEAFSFAQAIEPDGGIEGWGLLNLDMGPDVVPAIGDYPTVYWALGKKLGDDVEYVDEKGRSFRVRIVGMLKNSVLQGSLVTAESAFVERFPSEEGYRVILVEAPADEAAAISKTLTRDLRDFGLSLTSTRGRLAMFAALENTYLSIFLVLGGLGLILGSIGLGLVVLRNLLERRGEMGMLRAVGFSRTDLYKMVFYEHWGLIVAGVVSGAAAAAVAVVPAVRSPGGDVPYMSLTLTIAGIVVSGAVWVFVAAYLALKGALLEALRNE